MTGTTKFHLLRRPHTESRLDARVLPRQHDVIYLRTIAADESLRKQFVRAAGETLVDYQLFRDCRTAALEVDKQLCEDVERGICFERDSGRAQRASTYAHYLFERFRAVGIDRLCNELKCPWFGHYVNKRLCEKYWELRRSIGGISPAHIDSTAKREIEERFHSLFELGMKRARERLPPGSPAHDLVHWIIGDLARKLQAFPSEKKFIQRLDQRLESAADRLGAKLNRLAKESGQPAVGPLTLQELIDAARKLRLRKPFGLVEKGLTALWYGARIETIAKYLGVDKTTVHAWLRKILNVLRDE